jgi:uncharacterized protein YdeI (YjbR/CyaY-like superfamily)
MHTITAQSRLDLRKWLKKHHIHEKKVCVVIYKKHTGKPSPSHRELMEEAICFGWIDTTIKRLDNEKYMRYFCKRNKKSTWSDNTLIYAKDLVKSGKMVKEGLKYYKLGLAKPTHDFDVPKNPKIPASLSNALRKNKKAKKNFDKFPPSYKKTIYRWLLSAKLSATIDRRIKKIVKGAEENKRVM